MMGKCFKLRLGAAALAGALAFSALSAAMPGNVVFAEENVTEEVTDSVMENEEATEEVVDSFKEAEELTGDVTDYIREDTEVTVKVDENVATEETSEGESESASTESADLAEANTDNTADDEDEFVTVSGNIIGYEYDEPFEILFEGRNRFNKEGELIDISDAVAVAQDGHYSVKLYKRSFYFLRLPHVKGFCLYDPDNEGITLSTYTSGQELQFDIRIQMLKLSLDGSLDYGDLKDIKGDIWAEEDERIFDGSIITFESEDNIFTDKVYWGEYGVSLPHGEYTVTLTGKTGNVYSVEPFSVDWSNNGYVRSDRYEWPHSHSTLVYYGDYRTRDNEARIVCNFEDTLGLDLSNTTFYFVDSDNKRTNDCSYLELKYGLIRLPKDKTYKLVAEGLPEGYELDYGKMSDICPTKEHCGDGRYNYDVVMSEFVTVSGNIIGYEYDEPFEILFEGRNRFNKEGELIDISDAVALAQDGHYSVKLYKRSFYFLRLPNVKGFCLYDPSNEGITLNTFTTGQELQFDIRIQMLSYWINLGSLVFGDLKDINGGIWGDDEVRLFDGSIITFASEDNIYTSGVSWGEYGGVSLPHGEYTVTLTGKTGNVYSVEPLSVDWSNNGYVYSFKYEDPYSHSTLVYYGDYRTRDSEARIVCSFEDTLGLDLSNTTFYFVDSDKNRTNDCSYYEIKYGLIRLPKDKTYKLVASGMPEGYELDYGKMSTISPLKEHCGDSRYDYTVAIKKADPYKPLAIVKDTEDIVAKNGTKITFSIEAEGTGLKYSWYYKKPGSAKYTKAGVYTNEYTRTAGKSTDGMQVYCMVSDIKNKTVHGRVATLTLDKQIEISYPNGRSLSATKGGKVDFMIYAASDLKLTYSWYTMVPTTSGGDGKYHKAGCYTDTYTRTAGKKIDGMQAYCLITDSTGTQLKSDVITFNLKK